ncbi:MAG: helix-turn-helix transcriptional regulator [Crocinitomicaceae bacterium]|nr:helix-turn-helix transcriptional regulator [Crocinitomicaceae bacterium]
MAKKISLPKFDLTNTLLHLKVHANEMTQQELADKTGVTRQTIVAIENGKYSPTLELAFRIAHVFEVKLDDVFTVKFNK